MGHDATLMRDAQKGAPEAAPREQAWAQGPLPQLAPREMAQFLAQRPDRDALLMQLHQTRGNAYVQEVLAQSAQPKELATSGASLQLVVQDGDGDLVGSEHFYSVNIPGDGSPDRVQHNLFRDFYNATDEDIKALMKALLPHITSDDGKGTLLTAADLKKMGGVIKMHVKADWDGQVKKFIHDRHHNPDTDKLQGIVDSLNPPALRASIGPLLMAIANGDRTGRHDASSKLQTLAATLDPASSKAVREVIDGIQVNGRQDDSVLSLVRVQLQMQENPVDLEVKDLIGKQPSPFDKTVDNRTDNLKKSDAQVTNARAQIQKIENEIRARQESGAPLDREEGATNYEMMARLRDLYTGEPAEAQRDRDVARLYRTDRKEQDQMQKPGQRPILDRDPPGTRPYMRGPTEDEKKKREIEKELKTIDAESRDDTMYTKVPDGDDKSKFYAPTQLQLERASEQEEAEMGGGGPWVEAVLVVKALLEWVGAIRKMNRIDDLQKERKELTKRIERANTVRMPPEPGKLAQAMNVLRAHAAEVKATKPELAARYLHYAAQIEHNLDAARAAWDSQ